MYCEQGLGVTRFPGHSRYIYIFPGGATMSTAHKKCSSQNWAVLVSYSYRYSKPVLVHATDQDCKDNWGVVRGILDESSWASTPKFFNALKTTMFRSMKFAVAKPVDQRSPIPEKVLIGIGFRHEFLFHAYTVTSPKEFGSPTEVSAAFNS